LLLYLFFSPINTCVWDKSIILIRPVIVFSLSVIEYVNGR